MNESDMPNRRVFLGAVASASTAAAVAGLTTPAHAKPDSGPKAQGDWDLSWTERLARAKYRAVFDSPEIESGTALVNALLWLRDYNAIYGMTDAQAGAVIVIRHFAMPIVFGDTIWQRLKLGAFSRVKDPLTGEDVVRNPFAHVNPGEKTVLSDAGAAIDVLTERGVTLLCCNTALLHFADMLAKAENLTAEQAHSAIVSTLLPGTILMPSGIFAVTRAEEAGCNYIRST
jgi:hypothetical protein